MSCKKEQLALNQFSERTYDFLSRNYPEILEYATSGKSGSGDNFLKIEKQSPNTNAEYGLYFDSQNAEFTVGFDCFHCHFFCFSDQDFDSELINAVRMIKEIVNNELFILKIVNGDTYIGSQLIKKDELNSLDTILQEWKLNANEQGKVISWDGQFDKDLKKSERITIQISNGGDSLNLKTSAKKNILQKLKSLWF